MAKSVEKVTQDDVDAAQAALEQGKQRLEQLHAAFVDGSGEWQPVVDQRAVLEFAEAQVLRTAAAKRRYDAEVRNGAVAALRAEIDGESLAAGDEIVTAVANVVDALRTVAKVFRARNERIDGWCDGARNLGIGNMNGRLVPSPDDGGIALVDGPNGGLRVGERLLTKHFPGRILEGLLFSLPADASEIPYFRDSAGTSPINGLDDVLALVKNLDHEAQAIPADARFFRNGDGALYVTGPNNGFSEEVQKRDGLREITRDEALNG